MIDREFRYPAWQVPLQQMILEFDREKLTQKMQEMESTLFERLQQLNQARNDDGEKDAIFDALRILRVIKRDKLGFPDWK